MLHLLFLILLFNQDKEMLWFINSVVFFLLFSSLKCYVVLGLCSGILSLLLITAFDWYRFIILFPLPICRVLGIMQNKCKAILCSQKFKDLLGRTRIHILRMETSGKWCALLNIFLEKGKRFLLEFLEKLCGRDSYRACSLQNELNTTFIFAKNFIGQCIH